ncbi:MAG: aldo/keto reductase [Nitriliruptorales bacterium]|nr:aldo/keto reductase [Nitriliruptorales bacterium]
MAARAAGPFQRPGRLATQHVGGVDLTTLGFGGSMLGNLYQATTDRQGVAAVDAAWEAGVRYFDTAPHYGLGLSERRLGRFLAHRPRGEYVISTKVGRLLVDDPSGANRRDDAGFDVPAVARRVWDFSRDGIVRSLEGSLERLGTDHVDVVFLHDPDNHWEQAAGEGFPALAELRAQGVVGAIGAGMNQSAMLTRFVRETDMDVVMVAGRYTLLEQVALTDLLPAAAERGVAVVAASVFNSGVLATPRPAPDAKYNYTAVPSDLLERAMRIADVCERHGTTLPAAALHFPLGHPAVASVVVAVKDRAEMRANDDAFRRGVPAAVWQELRAEALLPPEAPVPGAAT